MTRIFTQNLIYLKFLGGILPTVSIFALDRVNFVNFAALAGASCIRLPRPLAAAQS